MYMLFVQGYNTKHYNVMRKENLKPVGRKVKVKEISYVHNTPKCDLRLSSDL